MVSVLPRLFSMISNKVEEKDGTYLIIYECYNTHSQILPSELILFIKFNSNYLNHDLKY